MPVAFAILPVHLINRGNCLADGPTDLSEARINLKGASQRPGDPDVNEGSLTGVQLLSCLKASTPYVLTTMML